MTTIQIQTALEAVNKTLMHETAKRGSRYWQPRHLKRLQKLARETIGITEDEMKNAHFAPIDSYNKDTDLYAAVARALYWHIHWCGRKCRSLRNCGTIW